MGLHYSERQYYDDPIKNAEFIRVYGATLYCSHGQPSYAICYRCKEDNEFKTSSQEDLKKAFHQKARETHPDKIGGDGELFKKIKNAYDNIKEQVGGLGRGVQVV